MTIVLGIACVALLIWAVVVTALYATEVDDDDSHDVVLPPAHIPEETCPPAARTPKSDGDWYGFLEFPHLWDGTCAEGREQSPIDLSSSITAAGAFPLTFNYKSSVTATITDTKHGECVRSICAAVVIRLLRKEPSQ